MAKNLTNIFPEEGKALISPSILAADFAHLGDDVADVCSLGIDYLHVDVMDGAFVPNISFGSAVMKSLNGICTVPYDVHLMVEEPARYTDDFVTDNTEFITVHYEACKDLAATIKHIHDAGVKAGVSIKPGTAPEVLDEYLGDIELVLVMSVEPGFGGQKFMPNSLDKARYLQDMKKKHGYNYIIEIDGGVGASNADIVREAGVELIVAGSAVFKAPDRAEAIRGIKGI